MKSKRLTAALTSALLLWSTAYAEEPKAPGPADATGATGPGVLMLELQGSQPGAQASPEELLAMQMLLLQLLMLQAEPSGSEIQIISPTTGSGTGI